MLKTVNAPEIFFLLLLSCNHAAVLDPRNAFIHIYIHTYTTVIRIVLLSQGEMMLRVINHFFVFLFFYVVNIVLTGRNVCLTDYDKRNQCSCFSYSPSKLICSLVFVFDLFVFFFRFINARRRIVQPMIDQSNRTGKFEERKKKTDLLSFSILIISFSFQQLHRKVRHCHGKNRTEKVHEMHAILRLIVDARD